MKSSRRRLLQLAAAAAAAALPAPQALAQGVPYPARPVRLVVGFAPGGSSDIAARLIGQRLSERMGQQFLIENRAGAGANIAAEVVVRAAADGYTLLLVSSADTINATLYPKLTFNFMRDIAPVASLTQQPQVLLASAAFPAKTFPELITYAKANPGKVTIASAGTGAISHLSGELLHAMTGVELVHMPYRGSGPALTDLVGGHVQISFAGISGSIEFIRSGRLRALAVTTAKRADALPDVPAIGEFVPGYEAVSLFGIGAPRNTPSDTIQRLNAEINAVLADPKIAARFADLGGMVLSGTPAAFGKLLENDTEKWGKVIRAAGIKAE